jgi:ACS family D-galactonate transporter-like MFS transporter
MATALITNPKSEPVPAPRSNAMPIVLGLLVLSVFINYIDRGNLSIAAPMIKDELGLSASQLGILLSSFFWTYGLFQILSGWLVDRLNVSWVMAGGFFLWSTATASTGLLHGFVALMAVRLVLGIGESVAFPSYSTILARYLPESRRGLANSAIASGLACGPAFGMLMGGMLMARFGWRSYFISIGLISLVWLLPWFRWMPRGAGPAATHAGPTPGILEILKQRSAWGCFAGSFCSAYLLYFLLAWLPFYLVRERHFSMDSMARTGGAIYVTQALCATFCGRFADRWITTGGTPTLVRKTFMVIGAIGGGVFVGASVLAGSKTCVALLMLTGASFGMISSAVWAITQTLAGPHASGRWTGLQCAFANSSGALASVVTGFILDRTGHFFWAFAVTASVSCVCALCWIFLVGPIEPVKWAPPKSPARTERSVVAGAPKNSGQQPGTVRTYGRVVCNRKAHQARPAC